MTEPPTAAARANRVDPTRPCLNCGDPTPGEYCPRCGQRKVDAKVSVRRMVADVLEDQFVVDRRLPITLGALLFKPGFLTVEHLRGRIVRYIRPFRLYLASSVILFLLVSFLSLRAFERASFGEDEPASEEDMEELAAAVARLDSVLADTTLPPGTRAALEDSRSDIASRIEAVIEGRAVAPSAPVPGDTTAPPPEPRRTRRRGDPGWLSDDAGELNARVNTGIARVDSALIRRLRVLNAMPMRDAFRSVLADFLSYVPTVLFILLPLFALALKLLYVRRKRFYAEHFVFLLHTHSFVFILLTIWLLLGRYLGAWFNWLLFGWLAVYVFLALRRVYGQGRLKTFVKYWTLAWMYFWILVFAVPFAFVATLLI